MRTVTHFVDGESFAGHSGQLGDIYNPNTGEVQAQVALAGPQDVAIAVDAAEAAFPAWSATNPQRRGRTKN